MAGRHAWWRWAIVASAGCARVQTEVTYTQTLVNREIADGPVANSTTIRGAPRLDGETLIVALRGEATCRTTTTPIYQRERHVHRLNAPTAAGYALSPTTLFVFGAGLGGAGVYGIADADSLAAQGGTDGTGSTNPSDYRYAGVISAIAGAALITAAIVDTVRLRDSDEDAGQVRGEPDRVDRACEQHPVSHAAVQAHADGTDWAVEATTDADGEVRLALHDLPEAAWHGNELTVQLTIAEHPLPVAVDHPDRVLAMLAADATTRVAADRERGAQRACADGVTALADAWAEGSGALAAIDARIEALARQEQAARTACGDRWRPAYDEQLAGVHGRIAAMQQTKAELEHKAAVSAEIDAKLGANDAVGLRALIAHDAAALADVRERDELAQTLVVLALSWTERLDAGDATARPQLCASRALVIQFAGAALWGRLRAEVVKRSSVVVGARLASALDGGSCR